MQALPPRTKNYHKNMSKAGDLPTCIICGRGIKVESPAAVRVHAGGAAVVTEEETAQMNASADLGVYPIGTDCLRRHPELKTYVLREKIS